jgi:hypothetical protein
MTFRLPSELPRLSGPARTARSAIKCLRRFIGRPAIPASLPPDEAGTFQQKVVQGWGQVQIASRLYSSLDERQGSGHQRARKRVSTTRRKPGLGSIRHWEETMIHLKSEEALPYLVKSEAWYRPLNLPEGASPEVTTFAHLEPRRQLLGLIALTGPENVDLPRSLPRHLFVSLWAIYALEGIIIDPTQTQKLLQDRLINEEMKAVILSVQKSGIYTTPLGPTMKPLGPTMGLPHNYESNLRIVQFGSVAQRVDVLKSLQVSEMCCLVSNTDPTLLAEVIEWVRHIEEKKVKGPAGKEVRAAFEQALKQEPPPYNLTGRGHEPRVSLSVRTAALLRSMNLPCVHIRNYGDNKKFYPARLVERAAKILNVPPGSLL